MKELKIVEPKKSTGKTIFNKETGFEYISDSHPPTVKDVLLARWAKDTEAMAKRLIEDDHEDGGYYFDSIETKSGRGYTVIYQVALDGEIAYLNSAAEGANQ